MNTSGSNVQEDVYAGSRHLAMYTNAGTWFFHSDQLGTERVRTTVSGMIDDTCLGMPFGDNQSCTGVPLRFAGYDPDSDSGLAHTPARYYSPALGRPDALTDTGRSGICRSDRFITPDRFSVSPANENSPVCGN